jgi:RNA recognition motif-containing protein
MATTVASNVAPSQSLYIQNLPEKLQKEDLRRELYMLFSTYGPVLDITAQKTAKMRGQAHILFKDTQTATQALRNCQGMEISGREMVDRHIRFGGLDKLADNICYRGSRTRRIAPTPSQN